MFFINLKKIPVLFLTVFIIYNLNFREISSGDTIPARFLPLSILQEFNLDLDEFPGIYKSYINKQYMYIQYAKGHWRSSYPVIASILAVPVYAVALFSGIRMDGVMIDFLSKIASSAIVALSMIFFFLALKLVLSVERALLISLLYAFATSNWSVASQGLWQHGAVELFLSMTLYFLLRAVNKNEEKFYIPASLCLALAVAARMSVALIAVVFYVFMIRYEKKHVLKFTIPAALIALLLLFYNIICFGSLSGGNSILEQKMIILKGINSIWTWNFFPGLAGLMISPNRGLLVYSPFLVFAFAGLWNAFRHKELLYRYLASSSLLYIFIMSFYSAWFGGFTYGYRYLLDIMPLLCLMFALSIETVMKTNGIKIVFTLLVVFSIFVQIVGFLNYPSGWNGSPVSIDVKPERVWDIRDNQILRCIRNGSRPPLFSKKFFPSILGR